MTTPDELLKNSKIIVAHPDDEVLWFGSVIDKVGEILVCYNDVPHNSKMGRDRAQVLADYPLSNISSLGVIESDSFQRGNWYEPVLNDVGLEFNKKGRKAKLKKTLLSALHLTRLDRTVQSRKKYSENYHTLIDILRKRLQTTQNVFTHNPWGEYGHEEHVQVFRVLETLQSEIGFKLWVSNYCGKDNWNLAQAYISDPDAQRFKLPVNKALAREIAELYMRNKCWTWFDDWQWADHDIILEAPKRSDLPITPNYHPFQLNKLF